MAKHCRKGALLLFHWKSCPVTDWSMKTAKPFHLEWFSIYYIMLNTEKFGLWYCSEFLQIKSQISTSIFHAQSIYKPWRNTRHLAFTLAVSLTWPDPFYAGHLLYPLVIHMLWIRYLSPINKCCMHMWD